jgi:hypothetical protein
MALVLNRLTVASSILKFGLTQDLCHKKKFTSPDMVEGYLIYITGPAVPIVPFVDESITNCVIPTMAIIEMVSTTPE